MAGKRSLSPSTLKPLTSLPEAAKPQITRRAPIGNFHHIRDTTAGQVGCLFDRARDLQHLSDFGLREKNRSMGEQVRPCPDKRRIELWISYPFLKYPTKFLLVEGNTETFPVESFRGRWHRSNGHAPGPTMRCY